MDRQLQFYVGLSLVDISATGVTRHRADQEYQRNQQRNWETVIQAMSLRTQPLMITEPEIIEENLDDVHWFGDMYTGRHKVWVWQFAVEHEDVFKLGDDPIGALLKDFEQVPVITGLDETAHFMLPMFYPYGAIKNIKFSPGKLMGS